MGVHEALCAGRMPTKADVQSLEDVEAMYDGRCGTVKVARMAALMGLPEGATAGDVLKRAGELRTTATLADVERGIAELKAERGGIVSAGPLTEATITKMLRLAPSDFEAAARKHGVGLNQTERIIAAQGEGRGGVGVRGMILQKLCDAAGLDVAEQARAMQQAKAAR